MSNTTEYVNGSAPGISADLLNEPFAIRAATWASSPSSQLQITIGPGRVDFSDSATTRLGVIPYGSTVLVTLNSPTASTTYYVFIVMNNDNPMTASDFVISTNPQPAYGQARLGSVTTPSAFGTCTRTDMRGTLPVGGPGGVAPGGTNPPFKIWVQSSDPGGAAANGDLWVHA